MTRYVCPCCGNFTLPNDEEYEICPVCFWERDFVQEREPEFTGGANKVSLLQARENYRAYGACREELKEYVRDPEKYELP